MKIAVAIMVLTADHRVRYSHIRLQIPEEYGETFHLGHAAMYPRYTVIRVQSSISNNLDSKYCIASHDTVSGWYNTSNEAIEAHRKNDLMNGPVTITYSDRWGNVLDLTIRRDDEGYEVDDGSSKTIINTFHVMHLYEYLEEKYPFSSYTYMNECGIYPEPYRNEELPGISMQGTYTHYGPR